MDERIAKLAQKRYRVGALAIGTVQERMNTCARVGCECKKGRKHGPYYYLSFVGKNGKVVHIYLQKSELDEVKRRLKNFDHLKQDVLEVQEAMKKR